MGYGSTSSIGAAGCQGSAPVTELPVLDAEDRCLGRDVTHWDTRLAYPDLMTDEALQRIPMSTWGRLINVPDHSSCYVRVEPESAERWKVPPPEDALRAWHRRPGPDAFNDHNYSAWFHAADVPAWLAGEVDGGEVQWLPEDFAPDL